MNYHTRDMGEIKEISEHSNFEAVCKRNEFRAIRSDTELTPEDNGAIARIMVEQCEIYYYEECDCAIRELFEGNLPS